MIRRGIPMAVLALVASGCAAVDPSGSDGSRDRLPPSFAHLGRSALRAALDPGTWLPAAGAIAFVADRFDRRVSDWASKKTPIFGSTSTARDASHPLLAALGASAVAAGLAAPLREGEGSWPLAKLRAAGVDGGAALLVAGIAEGLKTVAPRDRPYGGSARSFPSGDAAVGFSLATSTARHLHAIEIPWGVRLGLQAASHGTAGALAWARVEGLNHFPSDVLAGAAIGHFFAAFLHEAFLGRPARGSGIKVDILPTDAGPALRIGIRF